MKYEHWVDSLNADLELRGYQRATMLAYSRCVRKFLLHIRKAADKAGKRDAKRYLLYLVRDLEVGPAEHKMHAAALKFFFDVTLGRPEVSKEIPLPKVPRSLTDILSGTEVDSLLHAVEPLRPRMVVMTAYGAGVRIDEGCSLHIEDIDSKRMLIHIRRGKGNKDRYVMLPERLLHGLRAYWLVERPQGGYLFPGQTPGSHIAHETVREALRAAVIKCDLHKRVTPHTLRHCFATHMLEAGSNLRIVQALLGHASIRTTALYAKVSKALVARSRSPLDLLGTKEGEVLG